MADEGIRMSVTWSPGVEQWLRQTGRLLQAKWHFYHPDDTGRLETGQGSH